jgi:hypothetical protein
MTPFLQSVLDAVNNDPGGTAEAIRERHGHTETVTRWAKALRLLKTRYLIEERHMKLHVGLNASVLVYSKKRETKP